MKGDTMTQGFYSRKKNIYYGAYDESQVSGRLRLSAVSPGHILTDHPISGDEWAVMLWDNHRLLEQEYEELEALLSEMSLFMELDTGNKPDFTAAEKRLDTPLPKDLKRIWSAMPEGGVSFTGAERFLPLDELYVDGGNIVFYKNKRTPIAGYDIGSGRLSRYFKKEWSVDQGDICFYQFCTGRIFMLALQNKPVVKKGRCKGRFVTALDIEKELRSFCTGKYHLLPELGIYGAAAIYTDDGLLAWIRSNGVYADIHAGAPDEAALDKLCEHLGDMTWK